MKPLLSLIRCGLALGLSGLAVGLHAQSTVPAPQAPRPAPARATEVDRIVAVVNNEVITAQQLRARIAQAERQLARQNVQAPPYEVLERQLLERLIDERVQVQLAEETSLRVDDATLERAIDRIASSNQLSLEQLRQTLEADDVSWSRFREEIRTEILLTRLREREVDSRVVVTDAEIDNFVATNPDAFSGEEYEVQHILLRAADGASPEQVEALRARAEQVISRLHNGEDFARLAAEVSDAPDGLSGGNLGWRPLDRLPAVFADAVRRMQPGEVSPPMRSAAGVHIVRLADRRGGGSDGLQHMEQTHVRHILIRTSEVLSDDDAQVRLMAIRERVLNGADFGELAKASSADLSAAKGGDIGWVNPGDTVPEFERVMDGLQPGQVSMPVQSPFGWHLIEVLERRTQDVSDERKRAAARGALRERKADEAYEDWLRQLRDSAYIQLRLERE